MKRLPLALLLVPAMVQAQDFRHRYFHYDQLWSNPTSFSITDAAGNNKITFPTTADADDTSIILGKSSTTAPIFTIRGQTADGDDDGTLMLTPGGAFGSSRAGRIVMYGNEVGTVGGRTSIAGGDTGTGDVVFRTGTDLIRWAIETDGDLAQDSTNGGNIVMAKAGTGLITGISAVPSDITTVNPINSYNLSTSALGAFVYGGNSASPGYLRFYKSRASDGTADVVSQANDGIAAFYFLASDVTGASGAFKAAASLDIEIDGTPGSNDMPGRFVFKTSPDGSATPAEALRITSQGTTLVKGVAVAALPASCAPGSLIRATDSNDCAAAGGDGAMCICTAAGAWALAHNY